MAETLQIPKNPILRESKDFDFLRQKGVEYIQQFANEVWTDHNIHDPGITMLEAVCYALTELGFRLNLDIKDILASSPAGAAGGDFFPIEDILPTYPVTLNDFRKILIDLPEIKNAWIELAKEVSPEIHYDASLQALDFTGSNPLNGTGFYEVLIEMEEHPLLGNLNSSIITIGGTQGIDIALPSGTTERFIIEISFPFWDDETVVDLNEAITLDDITITSIPTLQPSPVPDSPDGFFYYAQLQVDYDGGSSTTFGVIIKIVSGDYTATDLPTIETAIENALTDTSDTGPVATLNQKIIQANGILDRVQLYLSRYRNLCETFLHYEATRIQEIAIHANLEVGANIDPHELLAGIYFEIDQFLSPEIRFYTLSEMLAKGKTIEDIYNGPLLKNGFIEDDELEGLKGRSVIYASDLIRIIMEQNDPNVVGNARSIISVQNFFIRNYLNNLVITEEARNCLNLFNSRIYKPKLSIPKSRIRLFRKGVELEVDSAAVIQLFNDLKAVSPIAAINTPSQVDSPGTVFSLENYRSIQNDLPQVYGTAPDSLPLNASPDRLGKAKQLKAFLLLFDQILANFLAQLVGVRQMLSIHNTSDTTYFYQFPTDVDLYSAIISPNYESKVAALTNDLSTANKRRSQFLDHLLARFGEELAIYEALRNDGNAFNIDKENFLQAYDRLSQTRNNAGLYPVLSDFALQLTDIGYTWSWPAAAKQAELTSPPDTTFSNLFELFEAIRLVIERGVTPANYQVSGPAGMHEIELQDAGNVAIAVVTQTYPDIPAADAAIAHWANAWSGAWGTERRSTFEKKLCHMLGFGDCQHQTLWGAVENVFDIIVVGVAPGETYGYTVADGGPVLMESPNNNFNPDEIDPLIYQVIEFGSNESNYELTGTAPNLSFRLLNADDQPIGLAAAPFADNGTRAEAIATLIELFTTEFAATRGFHLLEHLLLWPQDDTMELLDIHLNTDNEPLGSITDPYSFQLTIFLPAGAPGFRDINIRQLIEETIYTELPAHLLPRILWLEMPEFHQLETAYRNWIDLWVLPDPVPADLQLAQNILVQSLNAVTQVVLDT